MAYTLVEIPKYTNEYDELYDELLKAAEEKKAVFVPVGENVAPASYRQSIVTAMKTRKLAVSTACTTDGVIVWVRGQIQETLI